jgi:uncharacterized membrane protein
VEVWDVRPWFLRGWQFRPHQHPPHRFGRLGALVDGIFAIAATLLVIELRLPEDLEPGELGQGLAELMPIYVAYGIGFLQIAGGWLQNRRLEAWLRGVDHYETLLMLISVAVFSMTPFTTQVLARAFGNEADLATAVRLTAGLVFVAAGSWSLALLYARYAQLFRTDIETDAFTLYFRLSMLVWIVPVIAFVMSFAAPRSALALLLVLYVLQLLPLEAHPDPTDAPLPRRAAARPSVTAGQHDADQ